MRLLLNPNYSSEERLINAIKQYHQDTGVRPTKAKVSFNDFYTLLRALGGSHMYVDSTGNLYPKLLGVVIEEAEMPDDTVEFV